MLPPSFEDKKTHNYGTFTLNIKGVRAKDIRVNSVEPHFFGNAKYLHQKHIDSLPLTLNYGVGTNLWHFYAYLIDCQTIPLIFTDHTRTVYTSDLQLKLLPSTQILNRFNPSIGFLFQGQSYLNNTQQTVSLYDRANRKVGEVEVSLGLKFNEDINRMLYEANLIDFQRILLVEEISPLPSGLQLPASILPQEPPVKQTVSIINQAKTPESQQFTFSPYKPQKKGPQQKDFFTSNMPSNIQPQQKIDDEKQLQEDIDRLVAQMQSRPYDSSRYLDSQQTPKQNVNYTNSICMTAKSGSLEKRQNRSSERMPPRYPSSNSKVGNPANQSFNPILSYTLNTPIESSRANYLMNTCQTPLNYTPRSISRDHNKSTKYQPKSGIIRLKIHELMVQRMENELSLLLRLYLNDSNEEYYSTNSMRQGEAVIFNSNIKIDQKDDIVQLRFQLIQSYDMKTMFAAGTFQMKRLYDQNPTKGIFNVSMMSPSTRSASSERVIRADERQLVKVIPNIKSLRIQLQYQEPLQIVQIYLCLSQFSTLCRSCRYKVPLTKETIQFRMSQLSNSRHINLFPHNRSINKGGQKLIVELWGEQDLIGFTEVNLKQMYNTNQRMINSSLQPIHLYNQCREATDFKGHRTKGSLRLQLSYGTISQVQSLLNQNNRRQNTKTPTKAVEVESHLGIYIKENRSQKQVEIQVDTVEPSSSASLSRKSEMNLTQQEDLPDYVEEQMSQVGQSKVSQNEFLNRTMEQKYLKQETVPILSKKQHFPEDKQTVKSDTFLKVKSTIPLKSLTKEFQDVIKQTFLDFKTEKVFQVLKDRCQEHLLYNFIEKGVLVGLLRDLGVSQLRIHTMLEQILTVSNDMININVLYDLIYGLVLDGFVKQKYIQDYQLGRYCLLYLYRSSQEDEEWIQFVYDDNLQFEEARNVFVKMGIKLTMREFKQIQLFMKKYVQIYPKTTFKFMKERLIGEQQQKVKVEEERKELEKAVTHQLYNQNQWDQDDDFFISNINQKVNQEIQHHEVSTPINTPRSSQDISILVKPSSTHILSPKHDTKPLPQKERQPLISSPSPKKIDSNVKLNVEGFQSCIQAAQCHLNIKLAVPKLRISYSDQSTTHQLLLNRQQGRQSYAIDLFLSTQEEYLDGGIQLLSSSRLIAKCSFSIIKEVRSVYALKSIPQAQFCGLIYLVFRHS